MAWTDPTEAWWLKPRQDQTLQYAQLGFQMANAKRDFALRYRQAMIDNQLAQERMRQTEQWQDTQLEFQRKRIEDEGNDARALGELTLDPKRTDLTFKTPQGAHYAFQVQQQAKLRDIKTRIEDHMLRSLDSLPDSIAAPLWYELEQQGGLTPKLADDISQAASFAQSERDAEAERLANIKSKSENYGPPKTMEFPPGSGNYVIYRDTTSGMHIEKMADPEAAADSEAFKSADTELRNLRVALANTTNKEQQTLIKKMISDRETERKEISDRITERTKALRGKKLPDTSPISGGPGAGLIGAGIMQGTATLPITDLTPAPGKLAAPPPPPGSSRQVRVRRKSDDKIGYMSEEAFQQRQDQYELAP